MKKTLMAAAALAALTASPAMAADFTISGAVAATCNYSGGTIGFGTIATQSNGLLVASQSASSTAQAGFYCNGGRTTVEVTHTALTTGATATGFVNEIDYTPVVSIGDVDVLTGDQTAGAAFGARSGSLVVTAKNLTATDKVIAGDYSGKIVLTLTPRA